LAICWLIVSMEFVHFDLFVWALIISLALQTIENFWFFVFVIYFDLFGSSTVLRIFFWFLQSIENFYFFVFCLFTFDIFGSCNSVWIFIVNLVCFCICFSGMRRWSRRWSRFGVLVLCFVDVRAEAETEALADGISVSLVSIHFQFF